VQIPENCEAWFDPMNLIVMGENVERLSIMIVGAISDPKLE
jgi:hypothetical protein